jgi:hypothetical protein
MSMNMSIEVRSDYLNVLVTGAFDLQIALDLLGEILAASIQHKLPRILIDYRELQAIPPAMTEDYIYAASATQLIQKYVDVAGSPPRLAYLAPKTILEDGEYGTRVAAAYGFFDVKRTTDMDEALEWLGVSRT